MCPSGSAALGCQVEDLPPKDLSKLPQIECG